MALTKASSEVIDYIIIHELSHLKVHNHSQKFWNLVYKFDKNYKEKISWLEIHGIKII